MIPLHVKSHYSLGLGTASVERLVESAAAAGAEAVALTDLENLYGQIRFHHACASRGLRPITGVELRHGFDGRRASGRREGRLVLLARDDAGYANLCRIVSRRRVRAGSTSPLATGEDPVASLREGTEGLLVLTDHAPTARRLVDGGEVASAAVRLLLVRPGHGASREAEILAAAGELGVPLLADLDAVTAESEDHSLHVLLTAIRRRTTTVVVRAEGSVEPPERHLGHLVASPRLFDDRPEAVLETARVAELCRLDLRRRELVLPPTGMSSDREPGDQLAALCEEALRAGRDGGRFQGDDYSERLGEELRVIRRLGLAPYFLAVAAIVDMAAGRRIGIAGRGSAAGSLVSHLLGVTQVDPVAGGLYFERFLHERRVEPPDVDIDVDSRRREELIEQVRRRYGRERVAMVSTLQTFRRRSALREGLKALGMSVRQVEGLIGRLPPAVPEPAGADARPDEAEPHPGEAEAHSVDAEGDRVLEALLPAHRRARLPLVMRLRGIPNHLSVHPAGLVIAPEPLAAHTPLERTVRGVIVTQYDQRSLEETGLLKIDLLGNRALAEIDETMALLSRERAGTVDDPGRPTVPPDDSPTLSAIDRGDTLGCYQLESPAVRSVLRRIPVRSLEDVVAALAVVRPGAAAGRAKRRFVRRARGLEPAASPHPEIEERLATSHGVPLFEEDIIFVLHRLGGLGLADAEALRAAIVAAGADPAELERLREAFLARARRDGREAEAVRAAWGLAERFAAYTFSKAHAASIALLAYRTAFLQTHFPLEFGCALLNNHGGMYPPRSIAAGIARRGVVILAPSVVRSRGRASVERSGEGACLRIGLGAVRRLRRETVRRLLESRRERPFRDVADFLERAAPSRPETTALVLSGACDELPPLGPRAYPLAHEALLRRLDGEAAAGAVEAAIAASLALPVHGAEGRRVEKWRRLVRLRNELEHLDMHPSAHPLHLLREDAAVAGCRPLERAAAAAGERVRVAALLAAARRVRTRGGAIMQFLTLEDETGTLEAVLLPGSYERLGPRISTPGPYLVEGRVVDDEGDPHLEVRELAPFHERHHAPATGGAAAP